jgi:hypothetical protein
MICLKGFPPVKTRLDMLPQLRRLPKLTKEFRGPFPIHILPILTYWDFGVPTMSKWVTIEADKVFGERL